VELRQLVTTESDSTSCSKVGAIDHRYCARPPRPISAAHKSNFDEACWSKKTYNNAISVLRRALKFGYRDFPERHDPTVGLKSARIRKKDRPVIDPFTIQDAETLIAKIHRDWGEAQGNYDEFRFFTGLRPSEQVALVVSDFDSTGGTSRSTRRAWAAWTRIPPRLVKTVASRWRGGR
jgi:integrase